MPKTEIAASLVLSVVLIVGGYQFYFFTQRHPLRRPRIWNSPIDERIPFRPGWSWVYSFLYYPAILYLNLIADSASHFVMMAFSFILLLFMQVACFTVYPVATPPHWREPPKGPEASAGQRFLDFVQSFDADTNCFPSMHVSVATLTACHAYSSLGPVVILFPVLIGISCVFTKQHYLADLLPGAALGWIAWQVYLAMI